MRNFQIGFVTLGCLIFCSCGTMGAKPEASVGDVPSKGPVGKSIKSNSSKFAACARDSVTVQTGSTQHLQLKFTIDATGKVLKAGIDSMSEPDPDLYSCVLRVLKRIEFPPPKDRQAKLLTYPLVLKPE